MYGSPGLTHELHCPVLGHFLSLVGHDFPGPAEVDEFDVQPSPALHDDVVWLNVEVDDTAVVEELEGVQDLGVGQR